MKCELSIVTGGKKKLSVSNTMQKGVSDTIVINWLDGTIAGVNILLLD